MCQEEAASGYYRYLPYSSALVASQKYVLQLYQYHPFQNKQLPIEKGPMIRRHP